MIETVTLFNEEELLEFPTIEQAAKYLGVTADKVIFSGKVNKESMVKGFYVEIEPDRIVQYSYHTPVKIWLDLDKLSNSLFIHKTLILKSLKCSAIERIHFKLFSKTKGKKFY